MKPGPEPNTLPPTTRLVPIVAVKCWKCLKIAKKIAENPESPIEKSYSVHAVKWRAILNFLSHTCYSHTFGNAESLFYCKSSSTLSQIPVVLFELRISFNNSRIEIIYFIMRRSTRDYIPPPPRQPTGILPSSMPMGWGILTLPGWGGKFDTEVLSLSSRIQQELHLSTWRHLM